MTDRPSTMSPNTKIFLAVFLFIAGAVGIVLAVLNGSAKPAATTSAIIYGVIGVLLLGTGFVVARKRRF